VEVDWRESGGPPVARDPARGFGTKMIDRAMRGSQGSAELRFEPEGLLCTLRLGLSAKD
jgi:two-component sensor histidine kinase